MLLLLWGLWLLCLSGLVWLFGRMPLERVRPGRVRPGPVWLLPVWLPPVVRR
ncbi:MAG: hypothetical protein WAN20_13525 [Pseudonocardiaceae bacterium]